MLRRNGRKLEPPLTENEKREPSLRSGWRCVYGGEEIGEEAIGGGVRALAAGSDDEVAESVEFEMNDAAAGSAGSERIARRNFFGADTGDDTAIAAFGARDEANAF